MAQKGKNSSARDWCQVQKDLSVTTLSQSGVTTLRENVEECCLLLCHMSKIQPNFWVAATSDPAEDADIPVSAVSESGPTPASFPLLSVDLRGFAYIFPWRKSSGQSQSLLKQITVSGKTFIISCAVWRPGLPSCLASELHLALSAHSHIHHPLPHKSHSQNYHSLSLLFFSSSKK